MQQFEKAMKDLRTELGENLLPILTPFVVALTGLVRAFMSLPEPIQTAVVALGALAIAAGPIASVVTGIGNAMIVLGGLKIGATIAGWAGAIIPFKAALVGLLAWTGSTLIPALLAFFSGPVGWTVLAVAAVVAMVIAFRKPLGDFLNWLWNWGEPIRQFWVGLWNGVVSNATTSFNAIGGILQAAGTAWSAILYQVLVQPWINIWNNLLRGPVIAMGQWIQGIWQSISAAFNAYVVTPISRAWNALIQLLPNAMRTAAGFIQGVWTGLVNNVKGVLRGLLQSVANAINAVGSQVNRLIRAFNRLPGPDIPLVPTLSVPAFAKGGVVSGPTLAMVGEGGEPEYIIPQSKMAKASMNYLNGARGNAVIPAFAAGGFVGGSAQINVTTGPVMQQNGQQYVTLADLEKAMRKTADGVYASLRTPAGRYATGVR